MQWLILLLVGIAEKLITWFTTKGFKLVAIFLSYVTVSLGMFIAFVALCYVTINALIPLAPSGIGFGLALLPPSTATYFSAYMSILVAKRVYDYHKHYSRDFTQSMLRM